MCNKKFKFTRSATMCHILWCPHILMWTGSTLPHFNSLFIVTKQCYMKTACACLQNNHSSWLQLSLFLQLSNEMQLNVMNLVKSGKMSIDEVLIQVNNGTLKQRDFELEVQYGICLKLLTFMLNEDLKILSAF